MSLYGHTTRYYGLGVYTIRRNQVLLMHEWHEGVSDGWFDHEQQRE